MRKIYLPGEEEEPLLCLDPHYKDKADKEAKEVYEEDLLARGGGGASAVS